MWLRRKSRARHLAEEEEDRVIDLRERLAPYERQRVLDGEADAATGDSAPISARKPRQRSLRSR